MQITITNAGQAALAAGTGPILLTSFTLGSASGYIPQPTDTNIHGTAIYSGVPSSPIEVDPNTIKYSMYLDYNLGPFDFGEVGLYMQNGDLFALGAADVPIHKEPIAGTLGNSIQIDAYLSMTDSNYTMWFDTQDTANPWRMGVFGSVDRLPRSKDATPNAYIISGASSGQSAFIAYTDRNGLWNFDAYQYSTGTTEYTITAVTPTSVTIDISQYSPDVAVGYFGQRILQFTTGQAYSFCRYVQSIGTSPTTATLTFATPMALLPIVGDKFRLFSRNPNSNSNLELPIATTTELGAIIVGDGLAVDATGLTSVDTATIPGGVVISVNDKQGVVDLTAADIPGTVRTVNGTAPDANGNVNTQDYVLPIASDVRLGGVRIPAGGGLTINPTNGDLTFSGGMVQSVNGRSGVVTIIGLIDPTPLPNGFNLDASVTTGLFTTASNADAQSLQNAPFVAAEMSRGTLEVTPLDATGSGDIQQRWQQQGNMATRTRVGGTFGPWTRVGQSSLPIATTASLGGVIVGAGLSVTAPGVLSTKIQAVNGKSDAFIILTAADVGAIPTSEKNMQGGVAALQRDPSPVPTPTPSQEALSDFVYKRITPDSAAPGTWVTQGQWNASTNVALVDKNDGFGAITSHSIALQDDGEIQDTNLDTSVVFTAPAPSHVYEVSVAGTTALDGITSWSVGDLAVSVNGQWKKFSGGGGSGTGGVSSLNNIDGDVILAIAANNSMGMVTNPGTKTITLSANIQTSANDDIADRILTVGKAFGLGADNLLGTVDLNTVVVPGLYGQSVPANSTLARNYPIAGATASLLVTRASASNVDQLITMPGINGGRFTRTLNGVWSAWAKLLTAVDGAPVAGFASSRTLALSDAGVYYRTASAVTVTVPTNAAVGFPVGTEIHFRQGGTGAITFAPASGVTVNIPFGGSLVTAGEGATVTLKKVGTDGWDLFGVTAP
ncbi:tail fiber protein [Achromobacter phage Motura]|uniref:Tail fiber protein n=1 Tax=Achromobacter phage Motura TaxID=2591403 RepID=A0A514CTB0_9CAUD|nr:minor tail protein [Achromobacter phage Motura]QDH83713.1 tail fiber protein [Achromobacter phage Motura]